MTDFPDMKVFLDGLSAEGDQFVYRWTLLGTNAGPGGTGKRVHISGYEEWRIGADGLIAESRGHFDDARSTNASSNLASTKLVSLSSILGHA